MKPAPTVVKATFLHLASGQYYNAEFSDGSQSSWLLSQGLEQHITEQRMIVARARKNIRRLRAAIAFYNK